MSVETLLYIAAAAQFVTALWGGFVSLPKNDWPEAHPKFTIFVFAVLGLVGMVATISQGRKSAAESAEAATKLSSSLDSLSASSAEISRIQSINTDLQLRLLEQSKVVGSLAKRTVDEITGGDSFARLQFSIEPNGAVPIILHSGSAALPSLQVRIVDVSTNPVPADQLRGTTFLLPQLGKNLASMRPENIIRLDGRPLRAFNVFFNTSYRAWHQHILLYRTSTNVWLEAFRVIADDRDVVLIQCVHKNFPSERLDEGKWARINCDGSGWQ